MFAKAELESIRFYCSIAARNVNLGRTAHLHAMDYLPSEDWRKIAPKSKAMPKENVFSRNGTLRL